MSSSALDRLSPEDAQILKLAPTRSHSSVREQEERTDQTDFFTIDQHFQPGSTPYGTFASTSVGNESSSHASQRSL